MIDSYMHWRIGVYDNIEQTDTLLNKVFTLIYIFKGHSKLILKLVSCEISSKVKSSKLYFLFDLDKFYRLEVTQFSETP